MNSLRIYTYQDADGHTYYSFFRNPNSRSAPVRLTLQSPIGTHIINFLNLLREEAGLGRVDKIRKSGGMEDE